MATQLDLARGEASPAAFGGRWGLFSSRFVQPIPRPTDVSRDALIERMNASSARVVTVIAPAGYGKTTVLAHWADADPRPTVWLNIGDECNEPTMLERYLSVALAAAVPIPSDLMHELDVVQPRDRVVAARLSSSIAEAPAPFTLVLDDAHQLSDERCVGLLMSIVDAVPRHSQVGLGGRYDTAFPLASVRAAGDLDEFGVDDLRFGLDDAAALLRCVGAGDISDDEVTALTEQTEGWAVGLYLAARSRSVDPSTVAPRSFSGDDRYLADYIRETMLAQLPADEVDFLIRSSVLEELSGTLCDAALEITGSGARLEALESSNLLVVPLDHRRDRYRYHHLFRDLLRMELDHRSPELVPVITARASEWCEREGSPDLAVSYAMVGAQAERVADLIARYGQAAYYSGRASSVRRWFDWLEAHAAIDEFPMVAVLGSWLAVMEGRPLEAERLADAASTRDDGHPVDGELEAARALAVAVLCRHGVKQMQVEAERARSSLSPTSSWAPTAALLLGLSLLLQGDVEAAVTLFGEGLELAEQLGTVIASSVALTELAIVALERGDVDAAASSIGRALRIMEEGSLRGYALAVLTDAVAARVALVQGDPVRARRHVEEATAVRPGLTFAIPTVALQSRILLARCAMGLGDASAAETHLSEADEVVRHRPDLGTLIEDLEATWKEFVALRTSAIGLPSLTPAEARLLPLLTTHLSFREIGEQLFVSPHTVKTQAISIYRKLGVTSRGAAIETARQVGLLTP